MLELSELSGCKKRSVPNRNDKSEAKNILLTYILPICVYINGHDTKLMVYHK